MVRAIDRPSPVPCGLVVKNVSNTSLSLSLGMPAPESATDTSTSAPPFNAVSTASRRWPGAQSGHGIHAVRRQVDDDLLQMHLVGAHARGARRQLGVERDAPLDRLGLENVQRVRNYIVEIELPQLDRRPASTSPRRCRMISPAR